MEDSPEAPDVATGVCLWCGANRPIDVAKCPVCEHAWIDATIDEASAGELDRRPVLEERHENPPPWWRNRRVPLAAAGAALAVYGMVFWVMWDRTQPDPVGAPTTLVATSVPTATTPVDPTAAPATTAPATTPPTTTTTTTTTTVPPIPIVEPAYDPSDLSLGAFALGPIQFGSFAAEPVGRLAATFGQPDEQFPVGENWGLCPTSTGRALRWGTLSVILRDDPDGEVVVGYRQLDSTEDDEVTNVTRELKTISGLGIGDTLSAARRLYAVVTTDSLDDGTPIFVVLRSSDRRTLLWGELSSDEEPIVLSLNSPRSCDGGPFAS